MLIGVLALLWLAVLAPPLLRARSTHRRNGDLSDYYTSLSKLGRHQRARTDLNSHALMGIAPAAAVPARVRAARRRAAQRRRQVFTVLTGALGVTFVLAALSSSRPMWLACGVSLAALLAYTALVAHFQRIAAMPPLPLPNVSYLPARVPARVPPRELVLRRTANS